MAALFEKTSIGRRISGPAIVIALTMAVSHFGFVPRAAPFYDFIWVYFVPLAIALFLLKADLVSIVQDGGRVLLAFLIGAAGAAVGALFGALVLDLGMDEAKLTAVFSATYTGGSLNFAATADAVNFKEPSVLSAALAIDNISGTLYILLAISLGSWPFFKNYFAWRSSDIFAAGKLLEGERPAEVADILVALAIAATACAIGIFLGEILAIPSYGILFVTLVAVLFATLARGFLKNITGQNIIAMGMMYLFFAVIGAGADISSVLSAPMSIFMLIISIFFFHFLFLFAGACLFKLNYGEILVASLACIAGPPVAAAIAISFNWRSLVLPGIVTGIFGYVIGTFIGVAIFQYLS